MSLSIKHGGGLNSSIQDHAVVRLVGCEEAHGWRSLNKAQAEVNMPGLSLYGSFEDHTPIFWTAYYIHAGGTWAWNGDIWMLKNI